MKKKTLLVCLALFTWLLVACQMAGSQMVEVTREVEVTRVVTTGIGEASGAAVIGQVAASAETEPTPNDGAMAAAIWIHLDDPGQSTIVASDDNGGIAVYDLNGQQLQYLEESNVGSIDLRYNFPLAGDFITLVAAGVKNEPAILLYQVNPDSRQLERLGLLATGISLSGLCLYHSLISNTYYVIVNSEDGEVEQWALQEDGSGQISGDLERAFHVGSPTEGCTADDELAQLYMSEEEVAIWKYGAEPDDDSSRRIVDWVGGNISEQVKGLALYYGDDGAGYLIASNEKSDSFLVYHRDGTNAFIGSFAVVGSSGIDGLSQSKGIAVVNVPLGPNYPEGLFVAADNKNSDPDAATNFKLVSWSHIAAAMTPPLIVDTTSWHPRQTGVAAQTNIVEVAAMIESEPVPHDGDAADDPAIWIHPTDPAQSTIIATDKKGGLAVYDLAGQQIQYAAIGQVNNVDLRYNFPLGGELVTLVTAGNRTNNTIAIYKVNPNTREVEDVAARPIPTEVTQAYGSCMYRSAVTGKYYFFVNTPRRGLVAQWELFDNGRGRVEATLVRSFEVGSQPEGCVADDESGHLYIGEEQVGIWKYGAEPDDDDSRTQVDVVGPNGHLTADVEGLALYHANNSTGYLIASSQGSSTYAVYQREGDNAYLGTFRITDNTDGGIDGVSGTDGIEVMNFPLGSAFPQGVFIAQDNANTSPNGNQNFKFVPWEVIAAAFEPALRVDTAWDPRQVATR